jgi:hypothetical protein
MQGTTLRWILVGILGVILVMLLPVVLWVL